MLLSESKEFHAATNPRPAQTSLPEPCEIGTTKLPVVNKGITLTEVPNRIAVFFEIGNCMVHCPGCHSPELWDTNYTKCTETLEDIEAYIEEQYAKGANAVLFMGGLRSSLPGSKAFIYEILKPLAEKGYEICLYDGGTYSLALEKASAYCKWLKIGPYVESLGGLDSPTTNQRFLEKGRYVWHDKTKEYFQKEDAHEDH